MTTFIAVAGAKGGVGKTVTSINLVSALAEFGRSALLIDCDLVKPNIGIFLGITHAPKSIHTALKKRHPLLEAVQTHPSGIQVIPGSLSLDQKKEQITSEEIRDVFAELMGKAEVVLVDTPSSVRNDAKQIMAACNGILVITTADLPAVTDALKTIRIAQDQGKKILGVVLTHVSIKETNMEYSQIEATLGAKIIAEIPYDETIHTANYWKHPVVYTHFDAKATQAYKKLAANLIGEEYIPQISKKESVITYVLQRMGLIDPKR